MKKIKQMPPLICVVCRKEIADPINITFTETATLISKCTYCREITDSTLTVEETGTTENPSAEPPARAAGYLDEIDDLNEAFKRALDKE